MNRVVLDDLAKADMTSFPKEDPADLQRRAKLMVEEDKMRKEQEKERKAAEKAEAVAVKKAQTIKPVATKAEPVPPANADTINRVKVRLYYQHCAAKLQSKEPKNLQSIGGKELADLLASIEGELQSHGGVEVASNGFIGAVGAFEVLTQTWNPLGLHLSGPAASLSQTVQTNRKVWDEVVTEFAIANAEWFMMGPGKRMIGVVVSTVMAVDKANKIAITEIISRRTEVTPKEKEEAAEL